MLINKENTDGFSRFCEPKRENERKQKIDKYLDLAREF